MPGIKDFKKVANASEDTAKLQERLQEYLQPITKCPIIDGVLLTNISLTTGVINPISHKLGRAPLGWIVVRNRNSSAQWDTQDSNNLKSRTLNLWTTANSVVDLWIF